MGRCTSVHRPIRVSDTERVDTAATPQNLAPYKILKRGDQWVVVNNANMVKATFDDRDKALQYQRALYVNVKGAAKKADRVKWTGTKPKPKDAAGMIEGDDDRTDDLISSIDACLDAAAQQIMDNDVESLPGWAQQVMSLTISAGVIVDQLMQDMKIPDPDDTDSSDLGCNCGRSFVSDVAFWNHLQTVHNVDEAKHDLIFFSKRSTPLVVAKGASPSTNSNYTEKYGTQTSRRAATAEEEKTIGSGSWLRVDSKGKKGGQDGYKKTSYRPALVK